MDVVIELNVTFYNSVGWANRNILKGNFLRVFSFFYPEETIVQTYLQCIDEAVAYFSRILLQGFFFLQTC
jgi:hypothetical protein